MLRFASHMDIEKIMLSGVLHAREKIILKQKKNQINLNQKTSIQELHHQVQLQKPQSFLHSPLPSPQPQPQQVPSSIPTPKYLRSSLKLSSIPQSVLFPLFQSMSSIISDKFEKRS
mmetsp:Transcript_13331/g.13823  ORF Transcript_13331/g.13823 Transcript_13331/m.13823 type:complete len:116 (-) Transcript_13331:466-813(-)